MAVTTEDVMRVYNTYIKGKNYIATSFVPIGQTDLALENSTLADVVEEKIVEGGGQGLIYWEPAWVSTSCSTRWGQGSHWENATMFDENTQAHEGISFYNEALND